MARSLNFNNIPKEYLTVTLPDDNHTTLMILSPTKGMIDDFSNISDNDGNVESLTDLYDTCAKMMSRNKAGRKITTEMLEEWFDIEDIVIFYDAYMDFAHEVTGRKN